MAVVRRPTLSTSGQAPALTFLFVTLFVLFLYLALGPDDVVPAAVSPTTKDSLLPDDGGKHSSLRAKVLHKRQQFRDALKSLTTNSMPARLQHLREQNEIVGERLAEIREGTETVEEVLHGATNDKNAMESKPPMQLSEITEYLNNWIHQLHETLVEKKLATHEEIWEAYHDLTVKTLYPWDRDYLKRMPPRRDDGSIFFSLATYRDENCLNTITQAYAKAKNPEKLFVGLVQQNCEKHCKSGVLEGGKIEDVEPDQDCHKVFCESEIGKQYCDAGQVRALHIDEPESLGPYAARYFATKLWYGEQWFMQTDAHMTFLQDWDAISITMLKAAPSKKPVLSHYPPSHLEDLARLAKTPASRLCGPIFATSDLESQIVRLEGLGSDPKQLSKPRFAPFTAAGYFVAHSDFLREVPFDPFLPWIFMGEEIIMSSRLWTAGYDIFSPIQSVVGHIYVRRHKPKFWESVHRAFTDGVHNPLQMMVLDRIKYQLGYPEAARDMIKHKSLLTAVEQYTMGTERPLQAYLEMIGLNMTRKEIAYTAWCETGMPPPGFEELNDFYKKS